MSIKQYFQDKNQHFFRSITSEDNIADCTDINEKSEVDVEQAGMTQSSVNAIWRGVEGLYRTGMHPGISFCLRRNGHIVLNRALGHARGAQASEGIAPQPMRTDTSVCLYSASKAVMAMTVHKLAEEGHVHLLDPVAHYLPEFGRNGKQNITIHQMLSHRGGFPMVDEEATKETLSDREQLLELIYNTESKSPEGRVQAYHALTSGFIADELIRKTTGKNIAEYLKEKIADPMDMQNFTFGVSPDKQHNVARNYITGVKNGKLIEGVLSRVFGASIEESIEHSNSAEFMETIVPSANLYCTAEEIGRFYQMMLDHGRYHDKQIFQPTTIQKAIHEAGAATIDKSLFVPMRYSPGFMLGGNPIGMYGLNSHHAFGHLGFSNIFCWADPQRDISVALLTTGKPIIGNHFLALPKLLHTITKECAIQ